MTTIRILLFTLCIFSVAQAEVITDGSLGAKVELPGKDFQITPELGQQFGGNLFHSFQNFNLSAGESATFSGANTVQNVIARVTGGQPSTIDGTLRSTIPHADLYFINPYGVMFGQNAKLDLQGGFHASTADYLKLQDGGRFDARQLNNSLLTVAPVTAFGFLTDSPAPITTQDSTLMVPPLKPLSLIGGNLQLQGIFPVQLDSTNSSAIFATSLVHTTGGQLNLVAMGSTGEVLVNNNDLTLTGRGGDITLTRTLVDTSGLGGLGSGNLKVRGHRLFMQDSMLQTNTLGDLDGGIMDLQLTESLQANNTPFYVPAFNSQTLFGRGKGGSISIKVPELTLTRAWITTETWTTASTGDVNAEVTRLNLLEGATIGAVIGAGAGGRLTVKATDSIVLSGHSIGRWETAVSDGIISATDQPSTIGNYTYSKGEESLGTAEIDLTTHRLDLVGGFIFSASLGKSKVSSLRIQADNVNLTGGGLITTSATETGVAGNIWLDVKDTLLLSGRRVGTFVVPGVSGLQFENGQSNISSFAMYGAGGNINLKAKTIHLAKEVLISATSLGSGEDTGSINLQAETLLLTEGAQINSSNGIYAGTAFFAGNGHGGDIRIQAKQLTLTGQPQSLQTGIFSDTFNQGQGGGLFIQAESLDIAQGAAISARSYNLGNAGQLNLQAQNLRLTEHGVISTAATQAGGGNIVLNGISGLLHLDNSEITTSVATGQGSGGNINIEQPQFVVLNQSQIKAQADAGQGGNIRIVAQQFVPSVESLVSASSNLGIDGQISIESPTEDIGSQVLNLSANYLNAASLFPRSCAARIADQRPSQFVRPFTLIVRPKTMIAAPEDTRASPYPVTMHYKWFDQYR